MKISLTDFKRKPLIKKPIQVEEPLPPPQVKIISLEEEYIINLDKYEHSKEELDYMNFIQSNYPTPKELIINRIAKKYPLIKELVIRLNLSIENEINIVNTII